MWYLVAAISVVAIVVAVVFRSRATPSVAMLRAVEGRILDLQRTALADVIPDPHGELRGFDEQAARNRTATVDGTIRFVYTVEQRDGGFVHLVSSQLKRPRGSTYQVQCMLVVMLVLNRQLAQAGIKPEDVKFELDQSPLGTQFVGMVLNADQHARLSAAITGAA